MGEKFIADSMLGRLAKWLKVMGYDTLYQPFYKEGEIRQSVQAGRRLLSRHQPRVNKYPGAILILADHVEDQLRQLRDGGTLTLDKSKWFSRCLVCNVPLKTAAVEDARENIPEYVFYQDASRIRFCPSCHRYFWPGSHRDNMIQQLEKWVS